MPVVRARVPHSCWNSILRLVLAVVAVGLASESRSSTTVSYTATNDTAVSSGGPNLSAPVLLTVTTVTVTTNAPFCLPPRAKVSTFPGNTFIAIEWPCACVRDGDSVTVSVEADQAFTVDDEGWSTVPNYPALCPTVLPAAFRISDVDGDHDGYPDTSETFDLQVTLRNYAQSLTNVVARVATADPKIDCASPSSVVVGSLPYGGVVDLPAPFRLHVHPAADRGGLVPPVVVRRWNASPLLKDTSMNA